MPPVIVSLTTISGRLPHLHETLASLLKQSHRDFEIWVHLSFEPHLLDEGIAKITPECRDLAQSDPRLSFRYTPNTGPYRKLIPALLELYDQNVLIATADDDTLYPSHWLSTLLTTWRRHKCVVSYRGHSMVAKDGKFLPYRRWMTFKNRNLTEPSIHFLPTGKDGVVYHPSYFHPNVFDMPNALELAQTADDLWFKWHTAFKGVPAFGISPDYTSDTFNVISPNSVSLYSEFNVHGRNDDTISKLEHYSKTHLSSTLADLNLRAS